MPLRVTFQDIAVACGLGKSTVARVLSGNPHVTEKTRALVQAKALELGYRPDPALRILAQHRWNHPGSRNVTIALLSHKLPHADSADLYRASLVAAADRLGYHLEEFSLSKYPSVAKLGEVLYHRGIRGLIIPPIITDVKWNVDWSRFSAVGCGIGEFRLPIHSIDINYFAAVRLCWRKCVEAGHQRIGAALFRQPGSDQNDSLRYAAVLYEQSKLPPSAPRIPIFDGAFTDKAEFGAWVRRHRPTAVIALNALAYWHLRDLGFRVPEDISFCLATHPGVGTESLAGAATQRHRIAELAVNWLDQLLRTNECGLPAVPDEILIEPRWIEGPSLAAAAPAAPTPKRRAPGSRKIAA